MCARGTETSSSTAAAGKALNDDPERIKIEEERRAVVRAHFKGPCGTPARGCTWSHEARAYVFKNPGPAFGRTHFRLPVRRIATTEPQKVAATAASKSGLANDPIVDDTHSRSPLAIAEPPIKAAKGLRSLSRETLRRTTTLLESTDTSVSATVGYPDTDGSSATSWSPDASSPSSPSTVASTTSNGIVAPSPATVLEPAQLRKSGLTSRHGVQPSREKSVIRRSTTAPTGLASAEDSDMPRNVLAGPK